MDKVFDTLIVGQIYKTQEGRTLKEGTKNPLPTIIVLSNVARLGPLQIMMWVQQSKIFF